MIEFLPGSMESEAAPLVMIIGGQDWSARALESILVHAGYRVHRSHTRERGALDAAVHQPDAILVDLGPESAGIALCRQLSVTARVGAATPLIVTASEPDTRATRLEVLEAGAWEFLVLPPAVDELLVRLETWIRAKRTVDAAREEGLVDAETGFYNASGLQQRAAELVSDAARFGRPLSCVVFTLDTAAACRPGWCPSPDFFLQLRAALQDTVRTCDMIGRLNATQFAVLAPATDPHGAQRLAERVLAAVDRMAGVAGIGAMPPLRAGFFGVPDLSDELIDAGELLARAVRGNAPESEDEDEDADEDAAGGAEDAAGAAGGVTRTRTAGHPSPAGTPIPG